MAEIVKDIFIELTPEQLERIEKLRMICLMSLIKFGDRVVGQRGSDGGTVYSHNRGGDYTRNKVTPVNRRTASQIAQRNIFTSNSQAWRALTEPQRIAFNSASASFPYTDIFGDIKTLSGFGLFCKLNNNLSTVGSSNIVIAPTPAAVAAVTLTGLACTAGVLVVTGLPIAVPVTQKWMVYATAQQSLGRFFVKSQLRLISVAPVFVAGSWTATTAWTTKFGPLPVGAGSKIFLGIAPILISTGQAGLISMVSCLTA